MRVWLSTLGAVMVAGVVHAADLQLPATARQVVARDTIQDRYPAPIGRFADGQVPNVLVEGAVNRSAWRIDVAGLTPLQLIAPLRSQLQEAGFSIVLDCAAPDCGGYDFRFGTEVLPSPHMYVNIRNYHVLTAVRGDIADTTEVVSVLASASSGASYLQIIQAGKTDLGTTIETAGSVPQPAGQAGLGRASSGPLDEALVTEGHAALDGLEFASGTSNLGEGPFPSLEALVAVLLAEPDMALALVGHTDNVGGLEANMTLSRDRARSVRQHLITRYGIAPERLEAEGTGYLAPLASNATPQGREMNRRVEAVLLSR